MTKKPRRGLELSGYDFSPRRPVTLCLRVSRKGRASRAKPASPVACASELAFGGGRVKPARPKTRRRAGVSENDGHPDNSLDTRRLSWACFSAAVRSRIETEFWPRPSSESAEIRVLRPGFDEKARERERLVRVTAGATGERPPKQRRRPRTNEPHHGSGSAPLVPPAGQQAPASTAARATHGHDALFAMLAAKRRHGLQAPRHSHVQSPFSARAGKQQSKPQSGHCSGGSGAVNEAKKSSDSVVPVLAGSASASHTAVTNKRPKLTTNAPT